MKIGNKFSIGNISYCPSLLIPSTIKVKDNSDPTNVTTGVMHITYEALTVENKYIHEQFSYKLGKFIKSIRNCFNGRISFELFSIDIKTLDYKINTQNDGIFVEFKWFSGCTGAENCEKLLKIGLPNNSREETNFIGLLRKCLL